MRSLDELLSHDPAWPLVQEWIAGAASHVEVLPAQEPARSSVLHALQVTTRSTLGAVVYETGGLLIDRGWLRILGSGHPRFPRTLVSWNLNRTWSDDQAAPLLLLVADDVLGGSFAINGGGLTGTPGEVHYFAPDTLAWETLGVGYSDFLHWALSGDVAGFYATYRWAGWDEEVAALSGDQAFSIYPPLFAKGPPIVERSRRAVPLAELYDVQREFQLQLGWS